MDIGSDMFGSQSFKEFLGDPIATSVSKCGREIRYRIDEAGLEKSLSCLVATFYYYHSSFDYRTELQALGYSQTAKLLHQRRSGLPRSHDTQMGNFAEILGSEYGKLILGFDTTFVLPKRFNPNIDQSMKGVDILGIPPLDQPARLLLGESKCYLRFSSDSVRDSVRHLQTLWEQEVSRSLIFYKELLRLKGDSKDEASLDRIFYSKIDQVDKCTLMLIINGNAPVEPFAAVENSLKGTQLPDLICVHIQIESLKEFLPKIFQKGFE